MPTHNRRHLLGMAINSFYAQDWPDKELIVVDDGTDIVADCFEQLVRTVYIYYPENLRIGEKRNMACERASGQMLINWDDDDWSAPTRITEQVFRLASSGKEVTAYHSLLFWDAAQGKASCWTGEEGYGPGSTQCYRRKYWEANPHPNASFGEDGLFVEPAQAAGKMITVPGGRKMVARIHGTNVTRAPFDFPMVRREEIPAAFFEALAC
jgi:glycosyltransferase involved in cell wall biosynthesis